MQDKEMFDLFKSLDGITPPASVRERILNERILKEKDTPVNDTADEASVFSIIEDKRSDIAAPIAAEGKDTEKEAPPPQSEAKAKEIALFKQPKTFMYLGIAAACIAVIILGAFAVSFLGRDKKIDTAAEESSSSVKDKIFSGGDTMYKLLDGMFYSSDENGTAVLKEDPDIHADRAYRLKNGGYLIFTTPTNANGKKCCGAMVLDQRKNIVVEKDDAYMPDMKFLGSTEHYAVFGGVTASSSGDILDVSIIDLSTLGTLDADKGGSLSFSAPEDSEILSFTAVTEDYAAHPGTADEERDELDYLSIYFAVNTRDEYGISECIVYRMDCRSDKAGEVYTLKQKMGRGVLCLESVFAASTLYKEENIYAVYSEIPDEPENGFYKKTYYIAAINPGGRQETMTAKLFDESDPINDLTFAQNYQTLVSGAPVILNRNTGAVTRITDNTIVYKDGLTGDGTKKRYLKVDTGTSLMQLPTYENITNARYSAAEVSWVSGEYPVYVAEVDGVGEMYDSLDDIKQELRDKAKREMVNDENRKLFIARTEYSADGKPAKTLIAAGDTADTLGIGSMREYISFDGAAINLEDGYAVIEPSLERDSKDIKIHTADELYSGTMYDS